MTARRFDTDTLLEQILEGDSEAFMAFYERYRGRVYRFIVRLCGNGQEGKAAYVSVWARFAASRRKCKDPKALKLAFFKSLESPFWRTQKSEGETVPFSVLPRGLEEEGGWSVVLVQMVKRLPDHQRKRFLFRHEIGLSMKAVSQIFGESVAATRDCVNDAETALLKGLGDAGCTRRITLDALYRETRFLQPPTSWDQDILDGYVVWIEKRVPRALLKNLEASTRAKRSIGSLISKALGRYKSDSLSKNPHQPLGSAS